MPLAGFEPARLPLRRRLPYPDLATEAYDNGGTRTRADEAYEATALPAELHCRELHAPIGN